MPPLPSLEPTARDRRRGVLELVGSAVLFGLMAVATRRAAAEVAGSEVALVRFVVCVAALGAYAATGRRLRPVNWRALVLRGFFGGLAVLGYFVAISRLPVGEATLLTYTAPIATALFAALFLGERITLGTVGALALTSMGVALVVNANAPMRQMGFGRWHLVGLASALASGAAVTSIRWARRTDGSWEVFGAFSLIGALVCLPLAWAQWTWPSALGWVLLVVVGLLSVVAQLLLVSALRVTPAVIAGVVSQLVPLNAMALGALLLGERVSWGSALGTVVTLAGVLWGARARS